MLCKFVNKDLTAYNCYQYRIGEWHRAEGHGGLCTDGALHYYAHPLLAELLNPIHGAYGPDALLFEVEVSGRAMTDNGLKEGAESLRLVKQIDRPKISLEQRVKFAKLCADWARRAANGPRLDADAIRVKLIELAERAMEEGQ